MRKVQRWRYYCDFCKKCGGSAGHMKRHETGCTMNPERQCGLCRLQGVGAFKALGDLRAVFDGMPRPEMGDPDPDGFRDEIRARIARLRLEAGGCPACIFAALRQSGMICYTDKQDFDFRKERDAWMALVNESMSDDRW